MSTEHRNESRAGQVIGASILFITLCSLLTLLRVWARRLQKAPFMWGDALVPVGLSIIIVMCIINIGER
jgi:hypothetical protein